MYKEKINREPVAYSQKRWEAVDSVMTLQVRWACGPVTPVEQDLYPASDKTVRGAQIYSTPGGVLTIAFSLISTYTNER